MICRKPDQHIHTAVENMATISTRSLLALFVLLAISNSVFGEQSLVCIMCALNEVPMWHRGYRRMHELCICTCWRRRRLACMAHSNLLADLHRLLTDVLAPAMLQDSLPLMLQDSPPPVLPARQRRSPSQSLQRSRRRERLERQQVFYLAPFGPPSSTCLLPGFGSVGLLVRRHRQHPPAIPSAALRVEPSCCVKSASFVADCANRILN